MKQKSPCNNSHGFTLIEIIIAVLILASLSLMTATSMQNTVKLKSKVQSRIDRGEELRSALKVMKRDIQTAFHYNNYNLQILEEIKREIVIAKQQKNNRNTNQSNSNNQRRNRNNQQEEEVTTESIINNYIRLYQGEAKKTHFLGEKDALHFTSVNHLRRYKDAQESNLMEVGYYLQNCRSLLKEEERSNCLWRRSTPFLDEETDEGGSAAVLLENVQSLDLQYYDLETEEWLTRWLTNEDGSQSTRGKFPEAVKITIEVKQGEESVREEMVVSLFFTNNPEKKTPGEDAEGADAAQAP